MQEIRCIILLYSTNVEKTSEEIQFSADVIQDLSLSHLQSICSPCGFLSQDVFFIMQAMCSEL